MEIGTFKKLMSALVDSTMLYRAEIWGCSSSTETINQVQLHAFHVIWGGHPTPKDITDDRNGIVTISLGGKSEVHVVLVQSIDE